MALMDALGRVLASMDAIALEEMERYALMDRVDTKFVFSASALAEVLGEVADEYRVLTVADSPLSPYETLYFDTPDHECYLEHHRGKLNRCKYRMRRYVASDLCFLEVKAKNNKGRTSKERTPLDGFEQELSQRSRQYLLEVAGAVPHLLPQLWCEFSRITLVARQREERTTLDLGLVFRHGENRAELPGVVIAEIKQSKFDRRSPLVEALKRRGIRKQRVSKYCLGSILLKPHLKHNRFKARLKALKKIA